jgi:WD40 repeat protein
MAMRKTSTKRRSSGVVAGLLLVGAVMASPAGAAPGDPSVEQCFSSDVVASCTQIAPTFTGADVELSPDGKQLYMYGRVPALIRVFDRGPNNKLTPRAGSEGCYNAAGTDGCTAVPGLAASDVYDLDFSPDGTSIYAAAGGSLAHLQRNPATGSLTPMQCYGTGSGCTAIAPVGTVYTVVVSKDGQSVYTRGGGTFGAFQRNTGNGTLIPEPDGEDCFSETAVAGCTDTYGLAGNAFEMDFSPDGKFLYYPIQTPGGIGFFQRIANGTLTQISGPQGGCITTNGSSSAPGECATIADGSGLAMSNGWAATLSPSGKFAFLSSSSGTIVFLRDQENGKLTKVDCVAPSAITACSQRSGSAGMGVAVSPDGKRAIVGGSDIGGVGIYDFNEATGALTQLPVPLGCFSGSVVAGCSNFPGGVSRTKVTWAPNGLNFYATANGPVINMVLDYPPVCQSFAATVPAGISTAIGLLCSDPNGDPITLQISRAPTAGVLAGIDQAAGSVRYNPFSGYVGPDSFGYQGVARGVTSAEATVTLNVQSPSSPPAPLTNKVSASWKPSKAFTSVKSLSVADGSAGMQLRLICKGGGCPFGVKTIAVKKAGKQDLTSKFNFVKKVKGKKRKVVSKLAVKTVVEVQVIAADRVGKAVRYTMRKGKQPTSTTLCIPVGSLKPQASC